MRPREKPLCLFLDEHGAGLDGPRFVAAGVAACGAVSLRRASDAWRELRVADARFDREARKWTADQCDSFVSVVLDAGLLPLANYVRLDDDFRRALATKARTTYFSDSLRRTYRPVQFLWFHLVTQIIARIAATGPLAFDAVITSMEIHLDRGNVSIDQLDEFKLIAAEWTGHWAAERIAGAPPPIAAMHTSRCRWGRPVVRAGGGHALLAVADGMSSLVARRLGGCARASAAWDVLEHTLRFRGVIRQPLLQDATDSLWDYL